MCHATLVDTIWTVSLFPLYFNSINYFILVLTLIRFIYTLRFIVGWYRGEKKAMKFAVPRIWREPSDHHTDCYLCIVNPLRGKN